VLAWFRNYKNPPPPFRGSNPLVFWVLLLVNVGGYGGFLVCVLGIFLLILLFGNTRNCPPPPGFVSFYNYFSFSVRLKRPPKQKQPPPVSPPPPPSFGNPEVLFLSKLPPGLRFRPGDNLEIIGQNSFLFPIFPFVKTPLPPVLPHLFGKSGTKNLSFTKIVLNLVFLNFCVLVSPFSFRATGPIGGPFVPSFSSKKPV